MPILSQSDLCFHQWKHSQDATFPYQKPVISPLISQMEYFCGCIEIRCLVSSCVVSMWFPWRSFGTYLKWEGKNALFHLIFHEFLLYYYCISSQMWNTLITATATAVHNEWTILLTGSASWNQRVRFLIDGICYLDLRLPNSHPSDNKEPISISHTVLIQVSDHILTARQRINYFCLSVHCLFIRR